MILNLKMKYYKNKKQYTQYNWSYFMRIINLKLRFEASNLI